VSATLFTEATPRTLEKMPMPKPQKGEGKAAGGQDEEVKKEDKKTEKKPDSKESGPRSSKKAGKGK